MLSALTYQSDKNDEPAAGNTLPTTSANWETDHYKPN